jgi:regulator of protease activity HflC (stomatin/prohibitin superfamily)
MNNTTIWITSILLGIGFIASLMWIFPVYNVWEKEMQGKAELAQAEWSKQVAIEEARAKKESAVLEADAEIERARGVAEANIIIAEGLKNNEEYLRYLWITNLNQDGQVIYVPTEAGLPILEAGKR